MNQRVSLDVRNRPLTSPCIILHLCKSRFFHTKSNMCFDSDVSLECMARTERPSLISSVLFSSSRLSRVCSPLFCREWNSAVSAKTGKLTLNFSILFFSIREVADKINKYGTQSFPTLSALKVPAKQVVVGNSYLGVLLADGRAFRVAYSVIAERLDLSKHDASSKR